jgi:hypothetical protein
MKTSTKWLIAALVFVACGVVVLALGLLSLLPFQRQVTREPGSPVPQPTDAAIADGTWFGWIEVGRDEAGASRWE